MAEPRGGGFGGGGRSNQGGFNARDFESMQPEGVDLGDIFEGLFGGGGARGGGRGPSGFGRGPSPPPRKGADIPYRLRVAFTEAASRADQRITLADGKTIDLKLPAGVEEGTQFTANRNIPVNGGTVTVSATNVAPGAVLETLGERVRPDANGRLVIG